MPLFYFTNKGHIFPTELTTIQCNFVLTIYIALLTDGAEHQDELEVDGVPPYEDRLGPDG